MTKINYLDKILVPDGTGAFGRSIFYLQVVSNGTERLDPMKGIHPTELTSIFLESRCSGLKRLMRLFLGIEQE